MNRTNARAISSVLREPKAINWPGERIILNPTTCEAFGEIVDCIRVEMKEAS